MEDIYTEIEGKFSELSNSLNNLIGKYDYKTDEDYDKSISEFSEIAKGMDYSLLVIYFGVLCKKFSSPIIDELLPREILYSLIHGTLANQVRDKK